jgi:hypothetical protein
MRIAIATLALCGTARADRVLGTAGAGASTSGTTVAANIELELGAVALSTRGELGDRRATFLVGLAPHTITTPWSSPRCATACATEPRIASETTVEHRVVPLLGIRQARALTSIVLAARVQPSSDVLGDRIEVALTGVVAGRDEEFEKHARYMPGWYVAAAWRIGMVELGGEIGATGLEHRTMTGAVDPDAYALLTLGLAVSR